MMRWFFIFGLTLTLFIDWGNVVSAHGGGTPRIADAEAGPYRLFVWTQPEPLAVGYVHFSVMVTTPPTGKLGLAQRVEDVIVRLQLTSVQSTTQEALLFELTPQEYLGLVNYETDAQFTQPGTWRALLKVIGPAGTGESAFAMVVLAQRPINWPLLVIAGFSLIVLLGIAAIWSRLSADTQAGKR